MSRLHLGAAVLALLLTLAHGIGGHVMNLRPLADGSAGDGEKLELGAVWHLYTWQLALTTLLFLALLAGWVPASSALSGYVAATFLGGALVIVRYAAQRGLRGVVRHPQWVFLALLGALAWWAR